MEPTTGAAIIGAGASFLGGQSANAASAKQSRKQMDFQNYMSNTAHTREVIDLKRAGLNPMLSGMGGGGASSPPGSAAPQQNVVPDLSKVVSSALEAKRLKKDIDLADQQIKNQKAQKVKTQTETTLLKANQPMAELKNKAGRMAQKFVEGVTSSAKNTDTFGQKATKKVYKTYQKANSAKKERKKYTKQNPSQKGMSPLDFNLPF